MASGGDWARLVRDLILGKYPARGKTNSASIVFQGSGKQLAGQSATEPFLLVRPFRMNYYYPRTSVDNLRVEYNQCRKRRKPILRIKWQSRTWTGLLYHQVCFYEQSSCRRGLLLNYFRESD
jgi:hypothetical protein